MAAAKWQAARDFGARAHHADAVADHKAGFADVFAVALFRLSDGGRDERDDMRRCQRVEVFVANDFEPVADHGVERFAEVCISSMANSIASFSKPRLIAFCIAETQAIAGRPFFVSG